MKPTDLMQSAMESAVSQQLANSMKDAMRPQMIGGIKFVNPYRKENNGTT